MSTISSVKETTEFASLCSYLQLFGKDLNVSLSHCQLENYLEIKDFASTPKQWIDLHRKLLARIKIKCSNDKWENSLNKFINATVASETLTADFYGQNYFCIGAQQRARLLNIIFDSQFDKNVKFKEKINLRQNKDLRMQPFGSDIYGCLYWLFVDSEINMIMYKENLEEESFKIIAESIVGMRTLLNTLTTIDNDNVDLSKLYLESITPEDPNSPNTELDIVKDEDCKETESIIVKTEESRTEIVTTEMNGNKSPIKIEEETVDNTATETTLIIASVEKEEKEIEIKSQDEEEVDEEEKGINTKTIGKKKRGRKSKTDQNISVEIEVPDPSATLRRSDRKRKPVNPFTIMYTTTSTKKCKINDSQNDNIDVEESVSNKKKKGKDKNKEHSKKGRPNKLKKHSGKDKESMSMKKMKKKSKHKLKSHNKKHKKSEPWEAAESSEEHIEEEEEDLYHHDESDASHSMKEEEDLWNDKPESDFDPDNLSAISDEETLKSRGRNYFRQKSRLIKTQEAETIDDKPCQICLGNNLPEMILLCDSCDFGHHAMCLKPSLMIIPEGEWFCPKCRHKKLVTNLSEKISELDKLLAKNHAKIRMQERLNYVNISMTNILSNNRDSKRSQKSSNDSNSSSQSGSSSSGTENSSDGSSSSDSENDNHGRYKLRESSRKENTRYNFEEIDKIFDNALENDEKYQLMKKRQDKGSEGKAESEPEYDYSGIEPRKKSSGKDMSNILEEDKPRLRRPIKRKRLTYASDDDDFEDDEKDQDFKLSSDQSNTDIDDDEDEAKLSGKDGSDSDEQWTSRPRTRRSTRKSHKKKDKKKRRIESQDVLSRPRRSAARKVNYLEMLGELDDDNDDDKEDNDNGKDKEDIAHSPDFGSSDSNTGSKPPPVLARKKGKLLSRRRQISDSEYEESKDNSLSDSNNDSGTTEELQNVKRTTTMNMKTKKNKLCLDSDTDSERDDGDGKLIIEEDEEDKVEEKKKEEGLEGEKKNIPLEEEEKEEDEEEKTKEELEEEEKIKRREEEEKKIRQSEEEEKKNKQLEEEEKKNKQLEEEEKKKEGIEKEKKKDTNNKGMDGVTRNETMNESCLTVMNPMRAKDDQDMNVENEVESETETETDCDMAHAVT